MSRNAVFKDKREVVGVLRQLDGNPARRGFAPASYYLMQKLVKDGFVDYEKMKLDGRSRKTFKVSGKGRSMLALSKRWKNVD